MRKILSIFGGLLICLLFLNCEENTEKLNPDDLLGPQAQAENEGVTNESIPKPEFLVVATVNDVPKKFVAVNGTDKATSFDSGPVSQVVFSTREQENSDSQLIIAISIARSDLSLGEKDLSLLSGTRIDVSDISDPSKLEKGIALFAVGGKLIIEQIDTVKGIVAGSFEVDANEIQAGSDTILDTIKVTNGKFYFTYEVK